MTDPSKQLPPRRRRIVRPSLDVSEVVLVVPPDGSAVVAFDADGQFPADEVSAILRGRGSEEVPIETLPGWNDPTRRRTVVRRRGAIR